MGRPRSFDEDTVLTSAMETFWTHGYAGTSPALLADATGVAKGSLYNAFQNKRELFDRSLDLYHRQISAMAQDLLAAPGTARDGIHGALTAVVDGDLASPRRRGCLIGNTAVEMTGDDPILAERIKSMQAESTGWFAERIQRGQVEGDVARDIDAQGIAEFLATTLAGLRVMAMTQDAPTLHRVIDTAVSVL